MSANLKTYETARKKADVLPPTGKDSALIGAGFRKNLIQFMFLTIANLPARGPLAGCPWVLTLLLLTALSTSAQEALRNAQAGDTASAMRAQQMQSSQSQDYTFKNGDFRLLVLPSLGFDWNDNVNLSKTNALNDFILKPAVGLKATYPFTQRNLLYIDVTLGYDRYFNHPNLSSFQLNSASGTGLSFDLGIKDVTLNFHDWINYVKDSAQSATSVNTADYGTFQNTVGLSGAWDLNQASLSLGYDHQNVLATSSQFDSINHASEMLVARASLRVHPQVSVGLESTAAFTTYEQTILNNNDAYTAGLYTELHPGEAMSLTARGGFSTYQFQQTSSSLQTSSANSWYASLILTHQPRESLNYSLEAGHEVQLGVQSDLVEDWYLRPSVTWKFIKDMSFVTALFYEHGQQGVGNVTGNLRENFDWYGGQLSLEKKLTRRFALSLIYRLTLRTSNTPDQAYNQNLIGLQLTYHPQ